MQRDKDTTALLDPYETRVEEASQKPTVSQRPPVEDETGAINWDEVFKGIIELPFDLPRD